MNKFICLIISVFACVNIFAQKIDTSTSIFNSNFKTLKIQKADNFLSPPIIRLNSGEQIILSFDEISDDISYLQYKLVHCNADWLPSNLLDSEIVDGFNITNVDDYAFSYSTFVHFVNYRITIPNDEIRPTVSGNYLLQVFPENEPDDIILQARFAIEEPLVAISGEASSRTDKSYNDKYQQLNFAIYPNDYKIHDPFSDLRVVIEQNGRPDNAVTLSHPQRVNGSSIIYEHIPATIFHAGNEFRRFETVRANYPGMNVDSTRFENEAYNAYIKVDESRAFSAYSFDQTQRGRFIIDEYNSSDPDLGADYILTHFALDFPLIMNGDIFVNGEFTNYKFIDKYKMVYNYDTHRYELTLPLKQGSYNYQYLVVAHGYNIGDTSPIEGNHYETINEYLIKVFHHEPGSRADRLIGSTIILSGK